MDINFIKAHFSELLPKITLWAEETQSYICHHGKLLNQQQILDAQSVGVSQPKKIYLLELERFPLPDDIILQQAAIALGFLSENTAGLALGYGILIKKGLLSRGLLSHECRHVHQYEHAGSIANFLKDYLLSVLKDGYFDCIYEQDARRFEL